MAPVEIVNIDTEWSFWGQQFLYNLPVVYLSFNCHLSSNFFKTQRLAIELSRNHAPTPTAAGSVSDMSHVSLLEQSLDNIEDDNDHLVTKEHRDDQVMMRKAQSTRPHATVHTALDVETASGIIIYIYNFIYHRCSMDQ